MNKDILRLGGIAALLLGALVVAAVFYQRGQAEEDSARIAEQLQSGASNLVRDHSPTLGPKGAKVTVVEFLDPECESCRAMHPVVEQVLGEYEGRVRYVVRYMPLHNNSVYAAGALEAARVQGHYWAMMESLFYNQPDWGSHHAPRPELIPGYARELNLDMEAFQRFLDAGSYRTTIEIDRQDGAALGVTGTPTFFINGKRLQRLGYDSLKAMIEAELR